MSAKTEPVTVAELQAALRAVWAGNFRTGSGLASTVPPGCKLSGLVVMVVGCHGGAGASTVALSVAEALGEAGRSVRLLDCASPQRSGLLTAVDAELGVDGSGWRQGRRARLPIDRVVDALASATDVPAPPEVPLGAAEVTVVDTGWGAVDVLAAESWLAQAAESAAVVLVARATIPALRQLEQALATCPGNPVVAVLGPIWWHRGVHATAGPLFPGRRGCRPGGGRPPRPAPLRRRDHLRPAAQGGAGGRAAGRRGLPGRGPRPVAGQPAAGSVPDLCCEPCCCKPCSCEPCSCEPCC